MAYDQWLERPATEPEWECPHVEEHTDEGECDAFDEQVREDMLLERAEAQRDIDADAG